MCSALFFQRRIFSFLVAFCIFFFALAMQQMLDMNSCYNFRLHIDSIEMNLYNHTANARIKPLPLFLATRPFAQFSFHAREIQWLFFGLTLQRPWFHGELLSHGTIFFLSIDMTTNTLNKSFHLFFRVFSLDLHSASDPFILFHFFFLRCAGAFFFLFSSVVFSVSNEYF